MSRSHLGAGAEWGAGGIRSVVGFEFAMISVGWVKRSATQHPGFVGFRVAAPNLQLHPTYNSNNISNVRSNKFHIGVDIEKINEK
jgi:hypothetical protein